MHFTSALCLLPFLAPALAAPLAPGSINVENQVPLGGHKGKAPCATAFGNHFRQPVVLVEFLEGAYASYIKVPLNSYLSPLSTPQLPKKPTAVRIMSVQQPEGGIWYGEDRVHCSILGGESKSPEEASKADGKDGVLIVRRRDGSVKLDEISKGNGIQKFGCRSV